MFTSMDKALVAMVMGALYIVQTFTGFSTDWISAEAVASVIGILTPALVYLVPNKAA